MYVRHVYVHGKYNFISYIFSCGQSHKNISTVVVAFGLLRFSSTTSHLQESPTPYNSKLKPAADKQDQDYIDYNSTLCQWQLNSRCTVVQKGDAQSKKVNLHIHELNSVAILYRETRLSFLGGRWTQGILLETLTTTCTCTCTC